MRYVFDLKAALKRRGIKQKDLALLMDVNPSIISRWASGMRLPDAHDITVLAWFLDCTPGDFYRPE